MTTVVRTQVQATLFAKVRQVAVANTLLADAIAMAVNIRASFVIRSLHPHLDTARLAAEAVQALAVALYAFTIATALIWAHAHAAVRVAPAREAVADTFLAVTKSVFTAVVHAVRLFAICTSKALLALTHTLKFCQILTLAVRATAVVHTFAAATVWA